MTGDGAVPGGDEDATDGTIAPGGRDGLPCTDADLGSAVGSFRGDLEGADDDLQLCGSGTGPDMVLAWTAPRAGTYEFILCSTDFPATLAFATPSNCEPFGGSCNGGGGRGCNAQAIRGYEAEEVAIISVEANAAEGSFELFIIEQ